MASALRNLNERAHWVLDPKVLFQSFFEAFNSLPLESIFKTDIVTKGIKNFIESLGRINQAEVIDSKNFSLSKDFNFDIPLDILPALLSVQESAETDFVDLKGHIVSEF